MKTVVIDNYDSFTYNLVHYIEEITGTLPAVFRNDSFALEDLSSFDIIVLSPGPGLPEDAGLLMQTLETYSKNKIILGVCLGHQAIALYFGGQLENLESVYHGVSTEIVMTQEDPIFGSLTSCEVGRYHSWIVSQKDLPDSLMITSLDPSQNIMSLKHKTLPIHGVQFHPESVLTPKGKELLRNFFTFYQK